MTVQTTNHSRTARAWPAMSSLFIAVLVLGGCAATHVGDSWQCPVAQGAACTSVAEADPAVASPEGLQQLAELGRPRGTPAGDSGEPAPGRIPGCDPVAWLAKLLRSGRGWEEVATCVEPETSAPDERQPDGSGGGLRTKERIARIWIAPFVDSDGVYREGHWVRAVLEPARWRLR